MTYFLQLNLEKNVLFNKWYQNEKINNLLSITNCLSCY